MKNKDIHEWLLDEGIDPLTTVTTEKGEYYLSDILGKHLTEQLHLFAVSGSSAVNRCNECSKELESGTVFCSADCRQHYYH